MSARRPEGMTLFRVYPLRPRLPSDLTQRPNGETGVLHAPPRVVSNPRNTSAHTEPGTDDSRPVVRARLRQNRTTVVPGSVMRCGCVPSTFGRTSYSPAVSRSNTMRPLRSVDSGSNDIVRLFFGSDGSPLNQTR